MRVLIYDIFIEKLISYVEEVQRANSTIVAEKLIKSLRKKARDPHNSL